jgi:hypothetical protein
MELSAIRKEKRFLARTRINVIVPSLALKILTAMSLALKRAKLAMNILMM